MPLGIDQNNASVPGIVRAVCRRPDVANTMKPCEHQFDLSVAIPFILLHRQVHNLFQVGLGNNHESSCSAIVAGVPAHLSAESPAHAQAPLEHLPDPPDRVVVLIVPTTKRDLEREPKFIY